MDKFKYFAYGSNMLNERLQLRCSSASPVGTAFATDFELRFSKLSKDDSGKATLVTNQGSRQYGVLYEIASSQLRDLDNAEGAGFGYQRHDNFKVVSCDSGLETAAVTYIAERNDFSLQPFDWYLALVVAGAEQHKLPSTQISALQGTLCTSDKNLNRESRKIAIDVLSKFGIDDFSELLDYVSF